MASLYYPLNALFLFAFLPLRWWLPSQSLTAPAMWLEGLLTREMEVYSVALLLLLTRVRRATSWEEVLRRGLTIAKFAQLALLFLLDKRVCVLFLLCGAALFLVPAPRAADHANVTPLDAPQFQRRVRTAQADTWLVAFVADWCDDANLFRPIFSRIAQGFGHKVHCGLVDVVYARDLAREFQINDTYMTRQLPSVILFHHGREIRRLPAFKSDGSVVGGKIGYDDAVKFFELEAKKPSYARRPKGAKAKKDQKSRKGE